MTLTYPVLDRARAILFVVSGEEKAEALCRLARRDGAIPAGRITNRHVVVLADRAAAALLGEPAGRKGTR
jgi:6-phosphogluconolactonase